MITKYYANGFSSIEKVEYDRETDACFWRGNSRVAKSNSTGRHFDTREEAVAFLISSAEARITALESQIEYQRNTIAWILQKHAD